MSSVTVAPVRPHRGWLVPLLFMLILGVGRPLCLLAQVFIPLVPYLAPLPAADTATLLGHRIRLR